MQMESDGETAYDNTVEIKGQLDMRKFRTVYMRGGTSKGCIFLKEDLPADPAEWDSIFLQAMGDPDPKQIDGLGGTVSSSNKIVIVWKSQDPDADIEYLVGQVIPGKSMVDYKSNCGNMTAAVPAYAVEEGLVEVTQPLTTVRLLNRNTDKYISVDVPIDPKTNSFAHEGDCSIAGVDGTAAELLVNFLNPAGSKTGRLLPTGNTLDELDIPGFGTIEATILDVSNPLVIVHAEDVGLKGTELPSVVDGDERASALLEQIRAAAAVRMGFAKDPQDAAINSPAVPKIAFFTKPEDYSSIDHKAISREEMDLCVRVISVFKCHKACPLTAAGAISVALHLDGSILQKTLGAFNPEKKEVRIGHPGGVMTMVPTVIRHGEDMNQMEISGVAVQRTARRIMDGTLYIRR